MSDPINLILFGGNGDLARRMLFPSLFLLDSDDLLPADLSIMAVSRSIPERNAFLQDLKASLAARDDCDGLLEDVWDRFSARVTTLTVDAENPKDFVALRDALPHTDPCENVIFLAMPPRFYGQIAQHLKAVGLAADNCRIMLEKPIGHGLASSREINDAVAEAYDETAIFRIDHYLGKETVQNLIALRFANSLFEPLWNRAHIDHVQITVAETVGLEGRAAYYEDVGALRDMIQNHMLQLLCLVAMEPPTDMAAESLREEKVKVLRSLKPITGDVVSRRTVRGQYGAGAINGQPVPGYTEDAEGRASDCETFVALRCEIENWRWAGVPFYLRTGKRMPGRFTEIVIQFKKLPHNIFANQRGADSANKLIIRLQPEEKIQLMITNKVPGLTGDGIQLQSLPLDLSWSEAFDRGRRRIAYERLFLDAINGNSTLFVRRDEVEAAWKWVDGIIEGWEAVGMKPQGYSAGTWGPSSAIALTERFGHTWHE